MLSFILLVPCIVLMWVCRRLRTELGLGLCAAAAVCMLMYWDQYNYIPVSCQLEHISFDHGTTQTPLGFSYKNVSRCYDYVMTNHSGRCRGVFGQQYMLTHIWEVTGRYFTTGNETLLKQFTCAFTETCLRKAVQVLHRQGCFTYRFDWNNHIYVRELIQ